MSHKTIDDLLIRMKTDKGFRSRMLSAGPDGFAAVLRQEGYGFTPAELKDRLPAVKTGLRVGRREHEGGPVDCGYCADCGCVPCYTQRGGRRRA